VRKNKKSFRTFDSASPSDGTRSPACAQFHQNFKNSPHFIYFLGHPLGNARQHISLMNNFLS